MTASTHSKLNKILRVIMIVVICAFLGAMGIAIIAPSFPRSRGHCGQACVMNLRAIQGAKETWALENKKLPTDRPTDADLFGPDRHIRGKPLCPSGGMLTLNQVGEKPKCSIKGHNH